MPAEPTLERPLPQNLDAERYILGAIMLYNHALYAAIENLKPEDFFLEQHRRDRDRFRRTLQVHRLGHAHQPLHRVGELESSVAPRICSAC